MKNILAIVSFSCLLISCGDDNKKGLELISKSDCATCHKVSEAAIGPAYEAIASRYITGAKDSLSQSIIKGSAGKWGAVPMPPHQQVSKEDAEKMVEYILSLKK